MTEKGNQQIEQTVLADPEAMLDNLSQRLGNHLNQLLRDTIKDEVAAALSKALAEGAFYKTLNQELSSSVESLSSMIRETTEQVAFDTRLKELSDQELPEATDQLMGVIEATEKAAGTIFDRVDELMDQSGRMTEILSNIKSGAAGDGDLDEAVKIAQEQNEVLINITTDLGFQDLTGQKIKKIIGLINKVDERIKEIIEKFNASVKAHGGKAIDKLADREEVKKKARSIVEAEDGDRKKSMGQDAVDDLLSDLGF